MQYPNKLILVPLKSSEYAVEIVNAVANITLTQLYVNPTDSFLEVGYSFPISPEACIYRFAAEFGKTRVEGVVKEKEEAKREYKEAVSQGKRAAIGTIDENSKDILNLKVGNIGPREEVRIELVLMQELTLANNIFYQLRLFGTISPRYLNHLPKQALLEGFRNPTAKASGAFYWNFSISLRTSRKVVFFDSNSHDIALVSQNEQQNTLELAMEKAAVPNKDFVFTYTTEDFQLPSYVFGRTDCSSSAMLSFIPKFCTLNLDDAYKASVAGNAVETEIEQAKGEYVFLLDRSGSMGGKRIEKAKEALILFIKSLPEDTFFNVVSFGDASSSLFPKSVRYADTEVEKAVKEIKSMSANMGGTEVYAPLRSLLTSATIPGYPKQIFLLTDGGVSNTEGVIKMVAANTKFARVHTIGIGNGASEALIVGCAKSGKGHHVFISDADNPSEKIIQLLTDSLSPVISGMKLGFDKEVVASIVPNPDSLPYVLKGEVVNFYIAFKGQLAQPTSLAFSYEDSANKLPFASEIQVDPAAMNESFVDRMGHFRRIRLLEEALRNNTEVSEFMFAAKFMDIKAEIIKVSVRYQILSQFTAFLCVEKELIDGRY